MADMSSRSKKKSTAGLLFFATAATMALTQVPAHAVDYSARDCVRYTPLKNSYIVQEFVVKGDGYDWSQLRCAGARHINVSHPVDVWTEECIATVLRSWAKKETSNTNSGNWLYRKAYYDGATRATAYVVVNKRTDDVVTAYTSRGGSNDWYNCFFESA